MPPLVRTNRERAEEASLRADLDGARRKADLDRERSIAMALARLLARRDRQRDEAASLALRAIRIRDDVELRREVGEWLESLGEPALAAAVLGPLAAAAEPAAAVSVLCRTALLYARAGDAEGALDVLEEASERDPQAALPLELRGTIAGWSEGALSPEDAARAFAQAAQRRSAAGSDPFEDLLRAFEIDPTSTLASAALSEALAARGKRLAADEVRREHGRALRTVDPARAVEVHHRRRVEALEQGAIARALGAALDEGSVHGRLERSQELEDLLSAAGVRAAFENVELLFEPDALERAAESAPTNVRPVLLSFAAELLLAKGDGARARSLAERACDIEPNYPRSAASLAAAVLDARDAAAATALERAVRLVCARGAFCRALSVIHETLGAKDIAVAWAQHTVALRPGDGEALKRWFRAAADARDPARLGDAMSWAVAQPQPASSLAELVAEGLRSLVELDVDRAAVLARRALDAFGPHRPALRDAVELVADRSRDDALAAALIERYVSAGSRADERASLLLRLASLRSRLGDGDGEAIAIARALREGLAPVELEGKTAVLRERVRTSDGILATCEIEARVAQAGPDPIRAWDALRAYGAALADLGGDVRAAAEVWATGARLVPERARTVASDLREVAGHEGALAGLLAVLESEGESRLSGIFAEEASRAALSASQPARAMALAKIALERMPDHTDALEMAELGAAMEGRPGDVSPLYQAVARRALGKFGRRAAHFRAAHFFERQELFALALQHAGDAFACVPSESALTVLRRIAERAGERTAAVRAVVAVAEASRSKDVRGAWLLRAADLAGNDEEGARQRVDILLRGAVASPDRALLQRLAKAIHRLLELAPFERDALSLRVGNAARMLTARAEGPDGARIAIELARLAIGAFDDAEGGAHALARAMSADADLEEFVDLEPHADAFARVASKVLPQAIAMATKPYANVGVAALHLLVAIAEKAGAKDEAAQLKTLLAAREAPKSDDGFNFDAPAEAPAPTPAAPVEPAAAEGFRFDESQEAPTEETRDLEQQALDAARDTSLEPRVRAERLASVASTREAKGDLDGAADALMEAAALEPHSLERWRAAWTVAAVANRTEHAVTALEHIESLVDKPERPRVIRQLARALQEELRYPDALATWRRLLELAPDDHEADRAVEDILSNASDFEALQAHLAERARRLGSREDRRDSVRAARLRRAAILEQRLDRAAEASGELEALLAEAPDNESALRYLADLYERRGEFEQAAALLRRLAELARGPQTRNDLGLRAAFALRDAGDLRSALNIVKTLVERDSDLDAMALHVEIARALGDDQELGFALEHAAASKRHDRTVAAEMWVEAAQAAARVGNAKLALERARRGTEADPKSAEAQLFARGLEYRERGAGDVEAALRTIDDLAKIEGSLASEDVALGAFLRAEALTVAGRDDEAKSVLYDTIGKVGDHPLLSLGLAERLGRESSPEALVMFDAALAGDLYGFRSRAQVAIEAARVAKALGRPDVGRFLDVAEADQSLEDRDGFAQLRSELLASKSADAVETVAAPSPAKTEAEGEPDTGSPSANESATTAAPALAEEMEARGAGATGSSTAAEGAAPPALDSMTRVDLVPAHLRDDAEAIGEVASTAGATGAVEPATPLTESAPVETPSDPAGPASEGADAAPVPLVTRRSSVPPGARLADLEAAYRSAEPGTAREQAALVLAHAHLERNSGDDAEAILQEALSQGSAAAGDELAAIVARDSTRTHDLLRVRVRLAEILPGDTSRLEDLRTAAVEDKHPVYVKALEHLLRSFEPGQSPIPPPPLVVQRQQPGMLSLLARGPWEAPLAEAFALLHEHAQGVFARELASYSLTGLEHVAAGPTSALSRLLDVALRLLGAPALRLYVKRTQDVPESRALLIDAPAALLTGDVREETAALRYALGRAIGAALPENLLLGGLDPSDGRALWDAVFTAFGPADRPSTAQLTATSGRYAGALWERLPQRAQRRLRELLASLTATPPSYDQLREVVAQSTRRVGLMLAGNTAMVLRTVAAERGLDPDLLAREGGLARLAADPAIADLLRLAANPAYADARWLPLSGGARAGRPGTPPDAP